MFARGVTTLLLLSILSSNVRSEKLDCSNGRTCVYMKACKGQLSKDCPLAYSFKMDNGTLSLELAGYRPSGVNTYLAMGIGEEAGMSESKVSECSSIGKEQSPTVKLSYNTPGDESVNVRIEQEPILRDSLVNSIEETYNDGMIFCKWDQDVTGATNSNKVFKYVEGKEYYVIVAYGPTDANGLTFHDGYENSIKTDFSTTVDEGDDTNTKLVKAHGSLMVLAWLFAIPVAALFARFLRAHWPTNKPFGLAIWFHVHRMSNILGICLMIAGFVCIFIMTGWKWTGVGSKGNDWIITHSTVGIISVVLAWAQPFISILRCDPQNPRRPIFNWVHRMIGVTAFILAVTAISIASFHFQVWSNYVPQLVISLIPVATIFILFIVMGIVDSKMRVHEKNIMQVHAIRLTCVFIAISVCAACSIALVVMLIIA